MFFKGLQVEGSWVEEPSMVKMEVKKYFERRFLEDFEDRLKLDGIEINHLSSKDNLMLTSFFKEEEVKEAICDCGSQKSHCLNGYTFLFIKEFWELLKGDIMRFLRNFILMVVLLEVQLHFSSL